MYAPAEQGQRVKLIRCTDEFTSVPPGTLGTVRLVDSLGTVHVRWDTGHKLGLIPNEDVWEVVR